MGSCRELDFFVIATKIITILTACCAIRFAFTFGSLLPATRTTTSRIFENTLGASVLDRLVACFRKFVIEHEYRWSNDGFQNKQFVLATCMLC